MNSLIDEFATAFSQQNGAELAQVFVPENTPYEPDKLLRFYNSTNSRSVKNDLRSAIIYHRAMPMDKKQANIWVEVFESFWHVIGQLLTAHKLSTQGKDADWKACFESWKAFSEAMLQKGFHASDPNAAFPWWAYPCLFVTSKYMRILALLADQQARKTTGSVKFNEGLQDDIVDDLGQNQNLEEATRHVSTIFRICLGDRSPFEQSKKQALYHITNLSFKLHFQLNNIRPCANMIAALRTAQLDLLVFPKAEQVTFNYYAGVLRFLEEDYEEADTYFSEAIKFCPLSCSKNRQLILTYLIPCRILTKSVLPTAALLEPHAELANLFLPLARAIKHGNLYAYDLAMSTGEEYFVKRRIYLTLERAREICIRNLFHKVFLTGGWDPKASTPEKPIRETTLEIDSFVAGMRLSMRGPDGRLGFGSPGQVVDRDEVECLMANAFYKGHMKGYIRHDLGKVKFSKTSAFPPKLNQ